MSYVFSFTFFSLPLIFSLHWWPLAFLILSRPLQNFHPRRCSSNKQWLLCFLSLALDLCRPFSRWVSLACGLLSLFLCLSLALYSKFVDMTINLRLILWTTRMQKQFPLSVLVFIDSLVVSASQDAVGYAISRQNNLVSNCIWLVIPDDWVILHWYACGADGRMDARVVGVRSRDYQIFLDG